MELGPDERLHKPLLASHARVGAVQRQAKTEARLLVDSASQRSPQWDEMEWNGGFEVEPLNSPWLAAGQAASQLPTLPAHAPKNCFEVFLVIICSGSWSQGQHKTHAPASLPFAQPGDLDMAAGKTALTPPPRNGRCRAHERHAVHSSGLAVCWLCWEICPESSLSRTPS
jgi:hypothetical protein